MVHPGAIVALIVAKKAVAATVYVSLKRYGFPKVYRRLLEINKRVTPQSAQSRVKVLVKESFYAPTKLYALLSDPDGQAYYSRALNAIKTAPHSFVTGALVKLGDVLMDKDGRVGSAGRAVLQALQDLGQSRKGPEAKPDANLPQNRSR